MKFLRFVAPALVLAASLAYATSVGDLELAASTLDGKYVTLSGRIGACPDGTCTDRDSIISEFGALEASRTVLHADRSSLNPCSTCGDLDVLIGDVDAHAAAAGTAIDEWDGSS